ncbi:MAG: pyridoxal-5-phosphate-dependent protein subunit beta, partial [Clostridia bacterium]|nr:pyridoxal-5-phosphate-dependent protein subunit beta [Clostridia bacterium]
MIDLTKHPENLSRTIDRAKEKGIIIPTFAQMKNPDLIPDKIKDKLKNVGLWDINPLNLFRISWRNEPKASGGTFGGVNFIEVPSVLTGVKARIIILTGKWFPTGCHKVGASFGCLVPRLVTGQFDPTYHKAVWPSTGNYCRGGAFNSKLLACESVAILPAEMSKERFEWLSNIAGEVIATPGCESNVKEIFDKTWELRRTRKDCVIFNQFEEMGNCVWHYQVTGKAIQDAFESIKGEGD